MSDKKKTLYRKKDIINYKKKGKRMKDRKFLHVSEVYKRESILKNGLLPSIPTLKNHLDGFHKAGILEQDENKILYTWLSCYQDNKFIKDAVYYRVWIRPRNVIAVSTEREYSFINPVTSLYDYDKMIFDVYEISNMNILHHNGKYSDFPYYAAHWQTCGVSRYNTLYKMDTRYEHNDKLMGFSKTPEKNLKIIKQAKMTINKNGRVDVKVI
jgi:hypothetical protein